MPCSEAAIQNFKSRRDSALARCHSRARLNNVLRHPSKKQVGCMRHGSSHLQNRAPRRDSRWPDCLLLFTFSECR